MRKITLFLILAVVFAGVLFFWDDVSNYSAKLFLNLPEVEKEITVLVQKAEKQIITPEPLRWPIEDPQPFLTRAGVIKWTNTQRELRGLLPLQENSKLNASALLKAQDMLAKQYFEHISPLGEGVGNLAKTVGYEFIAIGENLAMGNFQNDKTLVQGWMDSPGHKANILSPRYQEIGTAVLQGEFEGKTTWLAVQHFGLPLTACPQPSKGLEEKIVENQKQLENLQEILVVVLREIENMRPKRDPVYSQKIEQYNELVSQYNALLSVTQDIINQYNQQVVLFNECVAGH